AVAQKVEGARSGKAEPKARGAGAHRELEGVRFWARKAIDVVVPARDGSDPNRVLDGQREDRKAIERRTGRDDPGRAEESPARFQTHDVVERGWNAADPAVSVPSAKSTRPAATATAEPELDPPTMKR